MTSDEPIYPDAAGFKEKGGTSEAAAKSVTPTLKRRQKETLEGLVRAGQPMTADELAAFMERSPFMVRPRVSELHRLGRIAKTGEHRKNTSGSLAAVWTVAKQPTEAAQPETAAT